MKFAVSISMERFSPDESMQDAVRNFRALAKVADEGGFETLWTAEHHTIECTISPNINRDKGSNAVITKLADEWIGANKPQFDSWVAAGRAAK